MGFRVQSLGFFTFGLRFWVQDLGFRFLAFRGPFPQHPLQRAQVGRLADVTPLPGFRVPGSVSGF